MIDMRQFALMLIQRNPNIANNPRAQEYIKVIQSGDSKRGAEIASNLCESYGTPKETAVNAAARFFGVPFK